MPGVVTIKLGFGSVIKRESLSLPLVGKKGTYKVLPFGSTKLQYFYTAMIQSLRKEWLLLYADTKHLIHLDSSPVTIICNDKIIIDDFLLYSNNLNTLIHYFACVT